MASPGETCDVLVIGGGPGGSTAATMLARKGWRVTMLEKSQHPRFHIGESLLPMCLPVFERLGVMEKVRKLGLHKAGADFEADNERGYNVFSFKRALGESPPYSFQVWRQDFDQMLFEHAREHGVETRENAQVVGVEHRGARDALVSVRGVDGDYQIQARYVVDASGRDAFLSGKLKLKRRNGKHQTAAIFGHFLGAERRPGEDAGNVSMYRYEHGWMWAIPLPDGVTSIGAVCGPQHMKERRGNTREFFFETLRHNAALSKRLESATLIDDQVRVTGNYAYESTRIGGPGWILIGDAFGFLDPVFSSGVYLAMDSAERAVEVVDAALRDPACEAAMQHRMEKRLRRGMSHFKFFVYRFNSPVMRAMFREPRNIWSVEQGVISMLAGDVYDTPSVLRRLALFRTLYRIGVIFNARRWWVDWQDHRRQARADFHADGT